MHGNPSLLLLIGHLLLGVIFVRGGIMHFLSLSDVAKEIAQRGIPAPKTVLIVGSAFQIIFGAMMMMSFDVLLSAMCLLVFTIAASWMMLNFWDKDGSAKETAKTNFESNVAIVGGLLVAAGQSWPAWHPM